MNTRIRQLRLEHNMTQQFLALQLNISQTQLSKIESGSKQPDVILLIQISRFFHVSIDYILYQTDERKRADILINENKYVFNRYQKIINLYSRLSSHQQEEFRSHLQDTINQSEPNAIS